MDGAVMLGETCAIYLRFYATVNSAFDNLHGLTDGRAFADSMKQSTNLYFGVAGPEFVSHHGINIKFSSSL